MAGTLCKRSDFIQYPESLSIVAGEQVTIIIYLCIVHIINCMHLCEHSFVQRSVYHLKAFVCHLGDTMKSGHYIAYVTDSTSWFKMDDYQV